MPITHHLAFEYSTNATLPEVLLGMSGAKERPDHSIAGVLKVSVTKEVVYSEWWFDGKLGYRQWDYPSGYAAYYPNLGVLNYQQTGRFDVIPLWLPTKDGARKFYRERSECESQVNTCIEKPGWGQIPLEVSEKVRVGRVELVTHSLPYQIDLAYEGEGSQLRVLEYKIEDFSPFNKGLGGVVQWTTKFRATALPDSSDLKVPDWRDFLSDAMVIKYNKYTVRYDPAKGSIDQQYQAVAKLNEDFDRRARMLFPKREVNHQLAFFISLGLAALLFAWSLVRLLSKSSSKSANGAEK